MPEDIELIRSSGHGLEATIQFVDQELVVMDGISIPGEAPPHPPGPLTNVELSVAELDPLPWADSFDGNPNSRRKELQQISGWSHYGFAQIVALNPTIVDFDLFKAEAGPTTSDESCLGAYVVVKIDRLAVIPA